MLKTQHQPIIARNAKHVVIVEKPETSLFVLLHNQKTKHEFNVMYQKGIS